VLLCVAACGGPSSTGPAKPCGVVPAVPSTSAAAAEAAGAPGLWSWDGSRWAWLANEPPPGPRVIDIGVSGGIAFDPVTSQVVHLNETGTHIWNGLRWIDAASGANPSPRLDAQLAFDRTRRVVVLFGGREMNPAGPHGKYLNDTWTWDGSQWHQKTPASSPDFGFLAANMVWDDARQVVVLFGATRDQAGGGVVSATWEWDGADWRHVAPADSPPQRYDGAMAFDGARQDSVLFGGFGLSPDRDFSDTWTWDGTAWVQRFPLHDPAGTPVGNGLPGPYQGSVNSAAMSYDPTRKVVVLVTTAPQGVRTWFWDGSDWTVQPTTVSPRATAFMSATYDTSSHRLLLLLYADPVPFLGPCQGGLF